MSLFTESSLCLVPSGVKDGKVYSIKPTDGSGDLTFTRASNATRVASNGLIEKVRTNLLSYSEQFDNVYWTKKKSGTGVIPVVTANTTIAPDGTTTADTVVFDVGAGTTTSDQTFVTRIVSATIGDEYGSSIYLKGSVGGEQIVIRNAANDYILATLTTSWQRFEAAKVAVATGWSYEFGIRQGLSGIGTINSTATIYAWGAQLETGVPTDYIATTSSAVSVGPVSGLPRLDYSGGASCPSLILEGQRTNLVTFSEQMDNADWTKSETTISANSATSPDGYTNADKLIASTTDTYHETKQAFSGLSGSYTISCFLKADGYNYAYIRSQVNTGSDRYGVIIDLTNGTTYTNTTGSPTGTSNSVTSYGNGWYRLSVTATTSDYLGVNIGPASGTTFGSFSLPATFAGNGTNGVLAYGCMAEAGAYATSYIPTLSSAVTRVADAINNTFPTALNQNGGAAFIEFAGAASGGGASTPYIQINGDKAANTYLGFGNTANWRCRINDAGTPYLFTSSVAKTSNVKLCISYSSSGWAMFANGVKFASGTDNIDLGDLASLTTSINDAAGAYIIKQSLIFPAPLTDAQAIELTTL